MTTDEIMALAREWVKAGWIDDVEQPTPNRREAALRAAVDQIVRERDAALALLTGLQGWLNDERWGTVRYMEGSQVYADKREWLARIDAALKEGK